MAINRTARKMTKWACSAALVVGTAGLAVTAGEALAETTSAATLAVFAEPTHEILLTTGKTVQVEILEETASSVKVNIFVGGLSAPRTYPRSEIITITELGHSPEATAETDEPEADRAGYADADIPENGLSVYVMELTGRIGWDISVTPVRDAMEEARKMGADVVIVKCNNDWKRLEGFTDELTDDQGDFEEYRHAEAIQPVFTSEMRANWDKQPQVVFWVERAMSGMAFLPLIKNDIYFTSDGRLGGVGDLDDLFGSMGDEVVRDKQKSLRLAHVKGMAIEGGHSSKLVVAMTKESYVLSYRMEGGVPVYLEGEAPGGWILLTDDGKDENADTDYDIVRGNGNDALTFDADIAYKLQLSKGTADTLEDLFFEMGIEDRAYVLGDEDDDGETDLARRELEGWSTGITRALQKLRRLQFDIANVEVRQVRNDPDGSKARNAARGQRIRLLNEAIALLNKYGEVLDPNSGLRSQYEVQKQQIENEKRLERTTRRRNGNGPG